MKYQNVILTLYFTLQDENMYERKWTLTSE